MQKEECLTISFYIRMYIYISLHSIDKCGYRING